VPVPRDTVALLPDYILVALVPVEQLIAGPQRAESRKQCEVILLVGLPGAGKTHWTLKHVSENADKRYEIIGPDSIIAKMTVCEKNIYIQLPVYICNLCPVNSLSINFSSFVLFLKCSQN